jgi:hypothetical protein
VAQPSHTQAQPVAVGVHLASLGISSQQRQTLRWVFSDLLNCYSVRYSVVMLSRSIVGELQNKSRSKGAKGGRRGDVAGVAMTTRSTVRGQRANFGFLLVRAQHDWCADVMSTS